jgi:hypothetical protein
MEKQNYNNHVRWYAPHHFYLYSVLSALAVACLVLAIKDEVNHLLWAALCILFILLGLVSLMLRQHYALMLQNRIIRLELRFRYYVLTNKRFEEAEARLSAAQIYALRFASDEELPALVERALKEDLPGDEIKRAVKNWLADEMRV